MKAMQTSFLKSLLFGSLLTLNITALHAQTETELIGVLQSSAGAAQKAQACNQLRLLGTAKAVPALAPLLTDQRVSQAARFALEGIAAPEAAAALRAALDQTSGALKSGVADSLGWKRDTAAVPLLKPLLADTDATVAAAAAGALGRIGGKEAFAVLSAVRDGAQPDVRAAVVEALLRCADGLLAANQSVEAREIYVSFSKPGEAEHVRVAAHLGLIRCAGKDALTLITSALQGTDAAAQTAALQVAAEIEKPKMAAVAAQLLPQSSPALQVALLALLRTRGDDSVLPAVQTATRNPDPAVRSAAFAALGELGDVSVIPSLAEAATSRDAAEQKAARQALASLYRGDVTGRLVALLSSASPAVQVELIRALTTRGEKSAVPALLQLARNGEPATRKGAIQALSNLAEGSHLNALVQLLAAARNDEARDQVVSVFESLSERLAGDKGLDFTPIVRELSGGDFEVRKSLLEVSALFVNDSLRIAFRAALKDSDERVRTAAARALCGTRDAALLPDLLTLARETSDAGLRSLAIEGIVRLATDEAAGLSAEQRTETLTTVFELARRVEDKRQVLSGLARVPNRTTLALAQKASADPAVKAEADAALVQLTQKLGLFTGPFIQDWLVCGPYRKAGAAGALAVFDVSFGPEKPGENVQWKAVPRSEQVNLMALFPGEESCAAYLKAQVIAPVAADALLLMGSDDGVKAWLNGKVVHANNIDRGDVADQDKAPIQLVKGTNELLLKITQGGGGWSARARVVGADGQAIAGLQVAPQAGAPPVAVQAPKPAPTPVAAKLPARANFKKLQLSDQFYAEGAYYGDFNRDGKMDIVAGPFWFEGPDFSKRHEYRPVTAYDPKDYSDNFLTYAGDCNGDGWTDIVCVPWPGKEGYWFANPAGQDGPWKKHLYYNMVGNESPVWADVTGDGKPELLFNNEGYLGYAGPDTANPTQPWVFRAISGQDRRYQRYTHGLGYGDINGDKRTDIIEAVGWWEQPSAPQPGQPWLFHPFRFADAAAQMLVFDVNGDGRADVVTSWHCHLYGMVWWEQTPSQGTEPGWKQHIVLSPTPDVTTTDFRVSQLHALALADMNGDGLPDVVTGKRFWAHGPTGDKEPDAPAVLFWFELHRGADGQVVFQPKLIDDNSGVGTQVAAVDLNGDRRPDVVVANKKGIFVHLSQP